MRPRRPLLDGATAALAMPDADRVVAASLAVARLQGLTPEQATAAVMTAAQLALARCRGHRGPAPAWLAEVVTVAYQKRRPWRERQAAPERPAGGL